MLCFKNYTKNTCHNMIHIHTLDVVVVVIFQGAPGEVGLPGQKGAKGARVSSSNLMPFI